MQDLVEADLWDQLPVDLPELLALMPHADLYLQDEIQFAFHPTLTRVWSRKGRREQRLVEAPGDNRKVYGFGCWIGAMAGSMAEWCLDAPLRYFVSKCV